MRHRIFGDKKRPEQVGLQGFEPSVAIDIGDAADRADNRGAMNDNIDRRRTLQDFADEALDFGFAADVAGRIECLGKALHGFGQLVQPPGTNEKAMTVPREGLRERRADAGAGTGDDD